MLKNLAAVLAAEEGTAAQALGLYGQAAMLDGGDIVLWNRMGSLVCVCAMPRPDVTHHPKSCAGRIKL